MSPKALHDHRTTPSMPVSLASLPYDILHTIITHFPTPSPLIALSQTSHSLQRFIQDHGWSIYLQTVHPTLYPLLHAPYLSHARRLTHLEHRHLHRTFSAHFIPPPPSPLTAHSRHHHHHHRDQQTLGFRPVLSSVCSALLIGAGPDLLLRLPNGHWRSYHGQLPGKDDITALQILPRCRAIVGKANGYLQYVDLSRNRIEVTRSLETDGRAVRNVATRADGVCAAVLAGEVVRIYGAAPATGDIQMRGEDKAWATTWLGSQMAVGSASDSAALRVWDIAALRPVREFAGAGGVFALNALPGNSQILLAGWYSGATRLHDLRSPEGWVKEFSDPLDAASPVYSVVNIGERVVVGGARHGLMKVFDIRRDGEEGYAVYLTAKKEGERRWGRGDGAVYGLAESGRGGGERVWAGVEGGVWEVDYTTAGRVGDRVIRYEFTKDTMSLWCSGEKGWRQVVNEGLSAAAG